MDQKFKQFRSFIYTAVAVLAGISIFLVQTSVYVNSGILTSGFHANLFQKHNIYSQVQNVIGNSIAGFSESINRNPPQKAGNDTEIFNMLLKSITPEMVKSNTDSLRDGLIQYFKGERSFLPDVYINIGTAPSPQTRENPSYNSKVATEALSKVDRINLNAILLYINRTDITEHLLMIKMVYYFISAIPGFFLLVLLLLSFVGLILCKKALDMTRWIAVALLSGSIIEFISAAGIMLSIYFIIPRNLYPVVASLPLTADVVLPYINDCLLPLAFFLLVSGVISIVLFTVFYMLPGLFPKVFSHTVHSPQSAAAGKQRIIRYSMYLVIFLLVISAMGYKIYDYKKAFISNDFTTVFSHWKSASTTTEVIPAMDDTIYALQIKLADRKSGKPVTNVQVNINGESSLMKKTYDSTGTVSDTGMAKFILDRGTFRLSFVSSGFPSEYQIPSPFFFDLKEPGTTIITVNLDSAPDKDRQKPGIVEIEILDSDNNPVQNLELSLQGLIPAPGIPDSLYSYSNSDGIAVFKVNEGSYRVNFAEAKFSAKYNIPSQFEVNTRQNSITRYTIRLSRSGTPAVRTSSPGPASSEIKR